LPGIGPGGEPGDHVELSEELAHHLVGIACGAQPIELGHHVGQRLLDVADGAFRVVLALFVKTALTAHELFTIEIGQGMQDGLARRPGIDQEAR